MDRAYATLRDRQDVRVRSRRSRRKPAVRYRRAKTPMPKQDCVSADNRYPPVTVAHATPAPHPPATQSREEKYLPAFYLPHTPTTNLPPSLHNDHPDNLRYPGRTTIQGRRRY